MLKNTNEAPQSQSGRLTQSNLTVANVTVALACVSWRRGLQRLLRQISPLLKRSCLTSKPLAGRKRFKPPSRNCRLP